MVLMTSVLLCVYTVFSQTPQLIFPSVHAGLYVHQILMLYQQKMAAPKKGMTYFPHLAPKEPSLEKHERGMFSQQACSLKPRLNMVFNRTLVLSPFFRITKNFIDPRWDIALWQLRIMQLG